MVCWTEMLNIDDQLQYTWSETTQCLIKDSSFD